MADIAGLQRVLPMLGERDANFARDLIAASARGLSARQEPWVETLIQRAGQPKPLEVSGNFAPIVVMLERAKLHLKFPRVLVKAGTLDLRLSLYSEQSRFAGNVAVTSTERAFADRVFYGRVEPGGAFVPSVKMTNSQVAEVAGGLAELAKDPATAAREYGRRFGFCCFCSIALTDPRSVHAGYGEACAGHFALPWGEKPADAKPMPKRVRRAA